MSILETSVMMKNIIKEEVESDLERMTELFKMMGKPERVNATGRDSSNENKDIFWLFFLMSNSIRYKVDTLTYEKENPKVEGLWSEKWNVSESEITDEYYGDTIIGQTEIYGWHPVFPLVQHYRSYDNGNPGITDNPYRGDHISIPIYSEHGWEIYLMDISFHKGDMSWEIIGFPYRPVKVKEELHKILCKYETR